MGKQQNIKHKNIKPTTNLILTCRLLNERIKIMNEKRFITIREAVKQNQGLSEYYFRKLIKDGRLPHIKSGKKVLIEVTELEIFLFTNQYKEVL